MYFLFRDRDSISLAAVDFLRFRAVFAVAPPVLVVSQILPVVGAVAVVACEAPLRSCTVAVAVVVAAIDAVVVAFVVAAAAAVLHPGIVLVAASAAAIGAVVVAFVVVAFVVDAFVVAAVAAAFVSAIVAVVVAFVAAAGTVYVDDGIESLLFLPRRLLAVAGVFVLRAGINPDVCVDAGSLRDRILLFPDASVADYIVAVAAGFAIAAACCFVVV